MVPDMAGPRVYEITELPRAGANLSPERAVGRRTWEEFLAERVGSPDRPPDAASPVSSPPAAM